MKYIAIIGLVVLLAMPVHAYQSGNVSSAMGFSSSSARSTSGYGRSRGMRDIDFFKTGSHVSSFGKGGRVIHCINCKGAAGIKRRAIKTNFNPPLPDGNWRHGHGPNKRTSRR